MQVKQRTEWGIIQQENLTKGLIWSGKKPFTQGTMLCQCKAILADLSLHRPMLKSAAQVEKECAPSARGA